MANNVLLNVKETFDLNTFVDKLAETYRVKGYNVAVVKMEETAVLTFEKGTGGINTILGLGEGIKVTCGVVNGVLNLAFSDEEWIGKIVGFIVGWFLCWIPIITAAIGSYRQFELPKNIKNDSVIIAGQL